MMMTDKECWKAINDLYWGKDCDYKRIQNILFNEWGFSKREFVERFVKDRAKDLYNAIKGYEKFVRKLNIGDDSLSDVVYHIIGLGWVWFDFAKRIPVSIEYRYTSGKYKESFAYCFQKPEPITEPVMMYNGNNNNELVIL